MQATNSLLFLLFLKVLSNYRDSPDNYGNPQPFSDFLCSPFLISNLIGLNDRKFRVYERYLWPDMYRRFRD